VRFNDYHKQICATLKLDEETARRFRTFCMRCYARSLSANMCLSMLQQQPEIVTLLEQRKAEREKATAT
jgi:hypothetical protein